MIATLFLLDTSRKPLPKGAYEVDDAQKKFGSAKAISSDQFFGGDNSASSPSASSGNSFEAKANLSRFQGSNSISSSDYFGNDSNASNRRGNLFTHSDVQNITKNITRHRYKS